jgi:uncharacterized protein
MNLRNNFAQAIDCHVHVWPDQLVQRNLDTIRSQSGISPAFDGSIDSLHRSMERSGVDTSIVNNIVLRPDLVKKANDWTASIVSMNRDLIGMGWVVAGLAESTDEVERCVSGLKFKGIKIHPSHSKIFPDDSKNYPVYERISELGVPVLFHCGKNPYVSSSEIQFSSPARFRQVLSSFNKMKVILGHLAGFEDFPEDAIDLLASFSNAWADTAVKLPPSVDIKRVVSRVGARKFVFGSDYPIYDPSSLIHWLSSALDASDMASILDENPRKLFTLS